MFKILPLITFLLIFSKEAISQIPNNGFEDWSGTNIISWVNTNGLMALSGNAQSVFKTSEAHSGNYACEMISTKVNNKPGGVFVPNYVGSIFVGKQILLTSYRGFPYTYKPNKFEFWYKYKPVGIDTANAFVALTKWNTNLNKRDTIAIGSFFQSNTDSASFIKASISLNYFDTSDPDTAIILFSAITNNGDHAGSKFIIDDLEFTGGNVGMTDLDKAQAISIFPNPSSDNFFIDLKGNAIHTKINLFNEIGQKVLEEEQNNKPLISVSTQNLPNGIYLLLIDLGKSTITRKIIVSN